ncbi:MAG TPA: flagellar motor protein MotB [Acidimicrobiales bacterium]|nr:flagellar motor protein MotB [Acidimicrobiales bacterium]
MSRPRKRHSEPEEEGASKERWLLTYSDMITLLMVLFIVLFALGQTDIRKFNAFKDSFHFMTTSQDEVPPGGPGVLSQPSAIALPETNPFAKLQVANANSPTGEKTIGTMAAGKQAQGSQNSGAQKEGSESSGPASTTTTTLPVAHGPSLSPSQEKAALANAERKMEEALDKLGLAGDVTFSTDQRGLVVSILTDKILFPTDSAVLQPEGVAIINAIAPVLAVLPNQVDVEGDTDDVPIHGGPYINNWALSAMRAVAVVDDLIDYHGLNPARLQATGNGDTRPIVPNDSPQHKAMNRRVEIVIFSTNVVTP